MKAASDTGEHMPASWRKTFEPPLRRRLCAGLALVSYLAASIGFPLPVPSRSFAGKPSSCTRSPCGCPTALHCAGHCCCSSGGKHGSMEQPLPRCEPEEAPARPHASCCHPAEPALKPCCAAKAAHRSCCQPASRPPAKSPAPAPRNGFRWVLGLAAQQCHGHSTLWVSVGTVLPPGPPVTWNPYPACIGWLAAFDTFPLIRTSTPPEPPPRWVSR
jgi:hypothetical protein